MWRPFLPNQPRLDLIVRDGKGLPEAQLSRRLKPVVQAKALDAPELGDIVREPINRNAAVGKSWELGPTTNADISSGGCNPTKRRLRGSIHTPESAIRYAVKEIGKFPDNFELSKV